MAVKLPSSRPVSDQEKYKRECNLLRTAIDSNKETDDNLHRFGSYAMRCLIDVSMESQSSTTWDDCLTLYAGLEF